MTTKIAKCSVPLEPHLTLYFQTDQQGKAARQDKTIQYKMATAGCLLTGLHTRCLEIPVHLSPCHPQPAGEAFLGSLNIRTSFLPLKYEYSLKKKCTMYYYCASSATSSHRIRVPSDYYMFVSILLSTLKTEESSLGESALCSMLLCTSSR